MLNNRWAALAVLVFTRIWMGFQFQSIPPIAPLRVEELGINHTQIGLLIGLYMVPGIFLALPGAFLGARIGDKQVVMIGLALMGLGGLVLVWGDNFWLACLGRVLSGTGAVTLNVQMMKMVTDWFAGKELATAMGILLITWPVGIALALATLGQVASLFSWQVASLLTVEISALALLAVLAFYRSPPNAAGAESGGSPYAIGRREFVLSSSAGWVWMIYNVGFIIVISFTPAFLMELGRSIGEAGFVSSLIMWVMVAAIPLAGLLADRLGGTRLLIIVGCLGTALGVGYLTQSAAPVWLVVAIGMMMGLPAGPIMTLPGEVLAPERRGVGLGIYFTWYYIGMAVFPPVAGAIQDATGGAGTSLLFAAALMAFTILMLGLFQAVKAGGLSLPGMKLPRRPGVASKQAQASTPPAAAPPRETAVFTTVRNIPPMPDA
ncbi:MAG: MFS transporter [SAR324 cluster bacterium]|nr:MFS transporter [SAR324 cluster bacterium]